MQKAHLSQLKRDCIKAVLLPVISLGALYAAYQFSVWALLMVASAVSALLYNYVYRFVDDFEDKSWQEQLHHVIEKVSAPALIVDKDHKISFANHSFKKLPIALLLEKIDNIVDLISAQDNKVDSTIKETLDNLAGKLKCQIAWKDNVYACSIIPLFSPTGIRSGFLLECQPFQMHQEVINQTSPNISFDTLAKAHDVHQSLQTAPAIFIEDEIASMAVKQSSHPFLIIDKTGMIQHASHSFIDLMNGSDDVIGVDLLNVVQAFAPNVKLSLESALHNKTHSLFVSQHFDKICDWHVNPIKKDDLLEGYTIEIIYPSRQELLAIEQNNEHLIAAKDSLERELRHFTKGLANCKLYQKGKTIALEGINTEEYHHPLIKNSSKIILALYNDLHDLHGELDSVKSALENKTEDVSYTIPLKQVNLLSNTLAHNVYEAERDLTSLHQELSKLKALLAEQNGLNHVYMKPLARALNATEQALVKTVNHSETVTLILQQVHENQTFLTQLQEFITKLSRLPRNMESMQTAEIYQDIIGLLERVRNSLSVGKLKLKELLLNFDGLNTCWKQAQENLQACIHTGTSFDQSAKRSSAMSNAAYDYSLLMQDKIAQLIDLTQNIQQKTSTTEIVVETKTYPSIGARKFDKMVLEVDETKKKAEDVLLEGLAKF
ncbi:MAG: hypothetical protein JSR17_12475 [Proteobacteria bacterium]|nr:hypothetical protein [Pseudomonadota bacterium]